MKDTLKLNKNCSTCKSYLVNKRPFQTVNDICNSPMDPEPTRILGFCTYWGVYGLEDYDFCSRHEERR